MARSLDVSSFTPARLEGVATGARVVGPFTPTQFVANRLTLTGNWAGSVTLMKTSDGAAFAAAADPFTGNVSEFLYVEQDLSASLYLSFDLTAGSATYVLEQVSGSGVDELARANAIKALSGSTDALTWANVSYPLYIAHRGGKNAAPENTMVAFTEAVRQGVKAVEMDAWLLADGALGIMHDSTTDRTCFDASNVAQSATFSALTSTTIANYDASGAHSGDFDNNPPPLLANVFAALDGKALMMVEAKGANTAGRDACAQAIADLAASMGVTDQVMVCSQTGTAINRKGCSFGYLNFSSALSAAQLDAIIAAGHDTLLENYSNITATYRTLVASKGLKLSGYTYGLPSHVSVMPDMLICDDPFVVAGTRTITTVDTLDRQYPGFGYSHMPLESYGGSPTAPNIRPRIRRVANRNMIGWPSVHPTSSGTGDQRTQMGICNLDITGSEYTLDFEVVLPTISNAAGYTAFFFELPDPLPANDFGTADYNRSGYMLGWRANNAADSFRLWSMNDTASVAVTQIAVGQIPTIVAGTVYRVRIKVAPAQIVCTWDVDGSPVTITATNSAYRGRKDVALQRRGNAVMITAPRVA